MKLSRVVVFFDTFREERLRHLEDSRVASGLFELSGKFRPSVVQHMVLIDDVIVLKTGSIVTSYQGRDLIKQIHLGTVERDWQGCHLCPFISFWIVDFS